MFEYLDRVNMSSPGAANKQLDRQVSVAPEFHPHVSPRLDPPPNLTSPRSTPPPQEFYQLYEALELKWELDRRATLRQPAMPDPPLYKSTLLMWIRQKLWWSQHPTFEMFVYGVITANSIVVVAIACLTDLSEESSSSYRPPPPKAWEYAFFAFYVFECLLHMFVKGWRRYFYNRWHQFDFIIVVLSMAGFLMTAFTPQQSGTYGTIFRSVRLLRLFRVRPSFRHVLNTMAVLFKHMIRYIIVLLAVQYTFAILGMFCFYDTISNCTPEKCGIEYTNDTYYQLNSFDNLLFR